MRGRTVFTTVFSLSVPKIITRTAIVKTGQPAYYWLAKQQILFSNNPRYRTKPTEDLWTWDEKGVQKGKAKNGGQRKGG
jgi:hypothetical protein